ncbi:hypothetical protein COW36_07115 [bacterium (Candidatus Blackallbacteria) CG17_big_fil_post_rev_8_21_14_2_50_48_46]|uniref:protein-glutamate O-methyltransferase n=1 Tax=bacterium (Candidatus Blackallbacteria) CG17_big_fil_post_rev_8_21_14_2_50_48_46 TaxID=2014261 RepID=A0A2M7G7B2_9BACT|nr:MAG: hypothetical protein COW64_06625 [bacterium (Candidatus Blackallbacteria) CG18_big_fil_WC_8_21_14_2_50_49_26]PIW17831.1 MAG: hypothetical protein COW36_07115 [bacterium (Candidatus Blackallbacteria) CG17_big_fil_post_rev_8_21_14_2_50_48_46]PIW48507.1 MAG: hypothetical protein COW20_09070 [bacterium (Candidatus Blackallbacteria) CG13_big_fil_rev_8_21_14_2_50_49_14]
MKSSVSNQTSSDDPDFKRLKAYVLAQTGLAFYSNKDSELASKFSRRLNETQRLDYGDYLDFLETDAGKDERERLIQELTIGETYFFRYHEQFDALREQILPELIHGSCAARQRLAIWSAGCATGEELYSISILLQRSFPLLQTWDLSLLGTDINRDFLRQAEKAAYRKWSFRNLSEVFLAQYFRQENQEWHLLPSYSKCVHYRVHNLIHDDILSMAPPGGFDVIFCRNVLIYFDQVTYRRLISAFYEALQPGGWLILGPAELSPLSCEPFSPHALSRLSCFKKNRAVRYFKSSSFELNSPPFESDQISTPVSSAFSRQSESLGLPFSVPGLPLFLSETQPPKRSTPTESQTHLKPESLATIRRLADSGQLDEAEALCRQFLVQEPLNISGYYYLALILNAQGQALDALQALKQVLYLDHKHILAHYHQGLLLLQLGQTQVARKAFRNALGLLKLYPEESFLADSDEWTVAQLKAVLLLQQKEIA